MIEIMPGVSIPEDELHFDASRSGGPGGQNVNKVSSRVTLTFDVGASAALSEDQKRAVFTKLSRRINKERGLRGISQRTRSLKRRPRLQQQGGFAASLFWSRPPLLCEERNRGFLSFFPRIHCRAYHANPPHH